VVGIERDRVKLAAARAETDDPELPTVIPSECEGSCPLRQGPRSLRSPRDDEALDPLVARPQDPVTFLAVAALVSFVGLGACALPALRAARVDPLVAIRAE